MNPPERDPISATVITRNEAGNIRECLESLRWVDDLVVVDSESTDRTVEIAREFTSRVHVRPWDGFVDQKNYACSLAEHDWVLSVDADERVTPELRDEILGVLSRPEGRAEGYCLPRRTTYLGRVIWHGGWYPDETVRLFRRSHGVFVGQELHERVEVRGRVERLLHPLAHLSYHNLSDQIERVDRYSSLAAGAWYNWGRASTLAGLLVRPPWKFFETYFWKLGMLDGMPGLIIAVMTSYYVFLKHAKLWELRHVPSSRRAVHAPRTNEHPAISS
ncbi:MAG: glycosyltransferase family 2 protein [Planctomycetes bacterium]|nr:glycosyltransferase family 2 protein [Planctomycetota bacterium]